MFRFLLSLTLICFSSVVSAQTTKKARYNFAAFSPGTTTAITSAKAGQKFDLAMFVQDLRPEGTYVADDGSTQTFIRGVEAAFANVYYSTRYLDVTLPPKFSNGYDVMKTSNQLPNGVMMGSVNAAFSIPNGLNEGPLEVCRVTCTAKWPGGTSPALVYFTPNFTNMYWPFYQTIVFSNIRDPDLSEKDVTLSPSDIMFSGVMVTITP